MCYLSVHISLDCYLKDAYIVDIVRLGSRVNVDNQKKYSLSKIAVYYWLIVERNTGKFAASFTFIGKGSYLSYIYIYNRNHEKVSILLCMCTCLINRIYQTEIVID